MIGDVEQGEPEGSIPVQVRVNNEWQDKENRAGNAGYGNKREGFISGNAEFVNER